MANPRAPMDGTDPDGSGGPHVFVDVLDAPELDPGDRHHLARIVRVRTGDRLTVGDGRGRWRPVRFGTVLDPTGPVVAVPAPLDPITVGFALIKGSQIDDVTRHLTELGVDVIVPFHATHSVVRWDPDTAQTRHRRLERIATEAAMQCRRAWIPQVEPLGTFEDLVTWNSAVVAQMGAAPLGTEARCVLIGPEGGWSEAELAAAQATASIGDHVLRAETAALTAGALLGDRRRGR